MSERWRRLGAYLLLFGIVGVFVELLLLEHHEDPRQWVPIVLLVAGGLVSAAFLWVPSRTVVRALRGIMTLCVIAALVGIYFHLQSNVEFELELRPSIEPGELVVETLKGAMPALAPGAMAQLGLLGLLLTYAHPLLRSGGPSRPAEGDAVQ